MRPALRAAAAVAAAPFLAAGALWACKAMVDGIVFVLAAWLALAGLLP